MTFHLTQALTGHGCFRNYLKRIGVYESAECPTCPETDEDVEHVLFVCPGFWEERERFRALWKGLLTPEGIGRCLRSSQRGWDAVICLATEVVDRLNSIRREEGRRESRPIEDQTGLREVMPNGGSREENYSRGETLLWNISRGF